MGAATAAEGSAGGDAVTTAGHETMAGAATAAADMPPAPCCSGFAIAAAGNLPPEASALAGVIPLSRADVSATHFARLQVHRPHLHTEATCNTCLYTEHSVCDGQRTRGSGSKSAATAAAISKTCRHNFAAIILYLCD